MKYFFGSVIFACTFLIACKGEYDPPVSAESLFPASIEMQSNRIKVMDGFNQLSDSLVNNSFKMLTNVESMLQGMNTNKDKLIDIIISLEEPFSITSNEPIGVDLAVSATTPPFSIGAGGLSQNFLLLSSSSRFLMPKNTIKSRFDSSAELAVAWSRAVEYSDQVCVYVALQTVDAGGNVTSVSNVLVVPLVTAEQCSVQL